ncbi:3-(2,3-dihydroxyphenyl)propionate dioxygenase [Rhodococcus sp. ACPA4]|uniref:3-carboxyethylcatechol 2,3-dioxygenase n=1 Tax=Rhodococcus TaxID=1827 RepID=UPI000BB0CDE2|nr:3-carboxyethylcatechol 2,3-dioxygenase [Rhodococcus sp. ACPA4]PBC36064.1 3-(2,3-dihydroxyphenyl)propionate dioxygenase [Rhodococcus sp. ACPA4]
MNAVLIAMSHSPLLDKVDLPTEIDREIEAAFSHARDFANAFEPEVVVIFSPDHYNGFFYRLMPQFCIGTSAHGVGDYGTTAGPLNVPQELASTLGASILDAGVDVAVSMDMAVDHGTVQPLEILFGDCARPRVVPIFVNSVAPPFSPMARVRALGEAVGKFVASTGMRTLFISSGGLSHDPPVPRLTTATEAQHELIMGRVEATAETRAVREERVIAAAERHVRGEPAQGQAIAPEWDRKLLSYLHNGDLLPLDEWTSDEMACAAGNSAHEVRTWLAGHAALGAVGDYEVEHAYYRPVEELLTGFGVQTLRLK